MECLINIERCYEMDGGELKENQNMEGQMDPKVIGEWNFSEFAQK